MRRRSRRLRNIFVAEENVRLVDLNYEFNLKLCPGYVTDMAVEAAKFAVEDSEETRTGEDRACRAGEVHARSRSSSSGANIKTTEAKLKAEEHSYGSIWKSWPTLKPKSRMHDCFADYGQIVYNVTDRRGGSK